MSANLLVTRTIAAAASAVLLFSGCAGSPARTPLPTAPAASTAGTVAERNGLAGLSGEQIVDRLDRTNTDRDTGLGVSVRYDELILKDAAGEESVPLQRGEFYLSLAPYVGQTHECFYHHLQSCQGELVDVEVTVKLVDDAGKVLVDQTAKTYENGFVGFWLPRNIKGTLTVTANGKTATQQVATGPDSPTCLTTVKLS